MCTSAKGGRSILRSKNEEIIDQITENTIRKDPIYKKRGSIIEHLFGTIKRYFGYTYFLTRGLESVTTEVSLICLAYNFKRMIKIIGVKELISKFKGDSSPFLYNIYDFGHFCHKNSIVSSDFIKSKKIVRLTHVRCEVGEKLAINSKAYLSLS